MLVNIVCALGRYFYDGYCILSVGCWWLAPVHCRFKKLSIPCIYTFVQKFKASDCTVKQRRKHHYVAILFQLLHNWTTKHHLGSQITAKTIFLVSDASRPLHTAHKSTVFPLRRRKSNKAIYYYINGLKTTASFFELRIFVLFVKDCAILWNIDWNVCMSWKYLDNVPAQMTFVTWSVVGPMMMTMMVSNTTEE